MRATEAAVGRILVLPAAVADAIAAGEVVDRPAAVVKELVENALDAGARRIVIRVEEAGTGLIEVVDDGVGILPEDLTLAFRRHATSKIGSVDELRQVRTLGFRGEALASIAAVAQVEAASRARGRGEGYRVLLEAGTAKEEGAAGLPEGTRVSVSRLFFNTPARLRFLKQPATETALIVRLAGELAVGNPGVAMRLDVDGRRVLDSPGSGDLRAAFAAVHGIETADAMLEVDQDHVAGLLSPPALHRASRDQIVIMVNSRRIHHRALSFAVEQAYRGLREPDRYPLAVLHLQVDPLEVDVNVHPTKREVRFRNEGAAFTAIERACFHALRRSPIYELEARPSLEGLQLRETAVISSPVPTATATAAAPQPADIEPRRELPHLTYVGQLLNGYLVCEAPDAAVLVDQHAAHERVLFERILKRLEEGSAASQVLLLPQLVELSPSQAAAFGQHREWLERLGFEAEVFGVSAIRLRAVPAELPEDQSATVITRLLADLDQEIKPDRKLRDTAALLACHAAVRFGDPMTPATAEALLAALRLTADPISCPHGRPTTLILPEQQLRRLFKRP
jgi:DNA mismatch repair protein MutL